MADTQVLARKWRPKTFAELSGQEHVVRALTNALAQQRLHHAYLFTGTRGVGKTTLARILAKSLNCAKGITPEPCGTCQACTEIDGGRFVDLLELDAASNTQVDNMRELLEGALYAPTSGRFKVYIIDEVHMLSKSAFNAMLKTLEEPPEHVKFVLATTDPQKIPVTILSRCLQFNLKQIPPPLISAHLEHVLEQEGIPFEPSALGLLARAARGSMRDALSMLDQAIAYGSAKVEELGVRGMLGAIDQSYLLSLLEVLVGRDGARLMAVADEMESRSLSFEAALQDLATLFHRIALAQAVPQAIAEDAPERSRILELAKVFTPEEIQLYYQIALHGRDDIGLAPDEYAGFTMTLMRMLAFAPAGATNQDPGPRTQDSGLEIGPASSQGQKARSSHPAPAPATHLASTGARPGGTESKKNQFDGDWASLVVRLKITGMAKMLAQHCELKSFGADVVELCVPEAHKHLMEKTYQEKLCAALTEHFGRRLTAKFSVGALTGLTPAELENQENQRRQSSAIEAIEKDPFVRDLIENFDARIIDSSIKPAQ